MLQPNFNPFPVLKTDRLILRELDMSDSEALFFLRSEPQVMKYIGRDPATSKGAITEFIASIKKNVSENKAIYWVIALKEHPSVMIGNICYWQLQPEHYRAEIGYALHPGYWKQGIMREVMLRVLEYGFDEMGLHSVEARLAAKNDASAAVLEATGFTRDGYFREDFFYNGKFEDTLVYSRLKS